MRRSSIDCQLEDVVQHGSDRLVTDWVPLSDLAEVNPRSPSPHNDEMVSFIAMADVSETGVIDNFELRKASSGYTPFAVGDVLVAKITPCFENGKGALVQELPTRCGLGSTEFHVLRARPYTSERYLYHLTRTAQFRARGEGLMSGSAGQRRVPTEFFGRYAVRVPPLEEQRRIAEILDTIDETIQATERVIAKRGMQLHGLAAYLMSPSASLRKWEERRLAEWTRPGCPLTYGIVQAGPHIPDGIPYIRTGDMTTELRVEGLLRTSPQIAQRHSRSRVSEGDIVCAIRATVGKILIVPPELDGANLTQGTARIAPGPDADRYCLLWALRSNEISRQIRAVQKGTTFQEITLEQLRSLVVQLPTELVDQRQLTTPLLATEEVIQAERRTLDKLKKLQSGLAADLLSGRVRTVAA